MKNKILLLCVFFAQIMLCSCGHNVFNASKGIGLDLSWSNIRLGYWDTTSIMPRGNSSVSTTTAMGGILGNGGTSQTISMSAGIQLNEDNIIQICINSNLSDKAKIELIKSLIQLKHQKPIEGTSKTVFAAAGTGLNSQQINAIPSGLNKAGEVIKENTDKIIDATKTTINKVGQVTEKVTSPTIKFNLFGIEIFQQLKLFGYFIIGIIILLSISMFIYIIKRRKPIEKEKSSKTVIND